MKKYIPDRIYDFYYPISFKNSDNIISEGKLCCPCSCTNFSVQYKGVVRKSLLGQVSLCFTYDNDICMILTCNKCGRRLTLFNNKTDGYDVIASGNSTVKSNSVDELKNFSCPRCLNSQYFVKVKYEHLPKTETDIDGISDFKNAFQWIWVDLECCSCSKKFKNFLDTEAG